MKLLSTYPYIDYAEAQLIFIRMRSVYLGSTRKRRLTRNLGNFSGEGAKLLGVDEFVTTGDLEFPVLFDKREGVYSFVGEPDAVDGSAYICALRSGYTLSPETR